MKRLPLILALGILATGCSKKEDAPPPNNPHVAGSWVGNGTDDAIGYYNLAVDLTQSGNSASGTFDMEGGAASVKGNVLMTFGAMVGNNLQSMGLTRTKWTVADPSNSNRVCSATLTVNPGSTFITDTAVSFGYTMTDCQGGTWSGGANLHKIAGTN
jgi:hypothetical protein